MKAEETIAHEFLKNHPLEAVRVLEGVTEGDLATFLESCGRGVAVAALQNVEFTNAARCLAQWSDEFVTDALKSLPISQSAQMLRLMEPADRQRMLNLAPTELARALRSLMHYPEGTAASHMNLDYVAYPQDLSVGETWKRLRRRRSRSGYYVYVVDLEGVLVGSVGFNNLLSADPQRLLSEITSTPVESIPAFASGRAILEHPGWRRFPDLPVVDESGVLLGVIRYAAIKELELGRKEGRQRAAWNVAQELGELYWSGSSQLLRGLAETVLSIPPGPITEEKAR